MCGHSPERHPLATGWVNLTRKAEASEIASILLLICINTARLILAGFPLAGIKFFTECANVLVLAGAGKRCLKHKNRACNTWVQYSKTHALDDIGGSKVLCPFIKISVLSDFITQLYVIIQVNRVMWKIVCGCLQFNFWAFIFIAYSYLSQPLSIFRK